MRKAKTIDRKQVKIGDTEMPIADITIGERHRSDLGDIEGLAASIADIGLLNPITVDERGQLLAGARRLAACKLLGLEQVEVRIIRERST
jgi:ParB family chromosome partitioning protein